jgi:hypothetical protein
MGVEDELCRLIAEAEKASGKADREKKEKKSWRKHWEKNDGNMRPNMKIYKPGPHRLKDD